MPALIHSSEADHGPSLPMDGYWRLRGQFIWLRCPKCLAEWEVSAFLGQHCTIGFEDPFKGCCGMQFYLLNWDVYAKNWRDDVKGDPIARKITESISWEIEPEEFERRSRGF